MVKKPEQSQPINADSKGSRPDLVARLEKHEDCLGHGAQRANEIIGRSGEIRTHDPCLPKTVLYQAELHSDRAGVGSANGALMQEAAQSGVSFSSGSVRGLVPVAGRDFERSTGVVFDRPATVSRITM